MKQPRSILLLCAAVMMAALIIDSPTALSGAAQGVQLCISTVIPSLFPFFVICNLITAGLSGKNHHFFAPFERALKIPVGTGDLVIMGLLGGYPIGAQCIAQRFQNKQLSKEQAQRMLAFCCNAGPAFLFGIGATLFTGKWICWLLWAIHLFSAFLVSLLIPKGENTSCVTAVSKPLSIAQALQSAVRSMGLICGWIVFFRTIIHFCNRWFLFLIPSNCQLLFTGLLELTNGCCDLVDISSLGLRMQLFSLFLGFGGLCVLLQTSSVLYGTGLSITSYFFGKLGQSSLSFLLCVLVQSCLSTDDAHWPTLSVWLFPAVMGLCSGIYWIKAKKGSSILAATGV